MNKKKSKYDVAKYDKNVQILENNIGFDAENGDALEEFSEEIARNMKRAGHTSHLDEDELYERIMDAVDIRIDVRIDWDYVFHRDIKDVDKVHSIRR